MYEPNGEKEDIMQINTTWPRNVTPEDDAEEARLEKEGRIVSVRNWLEKKGKRPNTEGKRLTVTHVQARLALISKCQ
jgi:hypothetical protein